ncbi:MAG: CrfX protein [Halopseudomonas sp.]|uniref:CrfX protein n=1 Tax=Halopseudomonas sp. TaxID=2901191 RepID=UPI0030018244
MSEDPLESRLRSLLQDSAESETDREGQRLDRVLHKAHIRSGVFDLINLFTRWGWVLSEGGARGARHLKPVSRATAASPTEHDNQ